MSRPLTLHVSALNDTEFSTYTSSIHDIVEHEANAVSDYDKLVVGPLLNNATVKNAVGSVDLGEDVQGMCDEDARFVATIACKNVVEDGFPDVRVEG